MIDARQISPESYARFLENVPHSPFQRLDWLKAVATVYRFEIVPLGYFQEHRLIAVTPLIRRYLGPITLSGAPLRKCAIPPATPFCAPTGDDEPLLKALLAWADRQGLRYLQVTVPMRTHEVQLNADRVEVLDNLELDVTPPLQSLWRGLSQLPRRGVRKALREGIRIHWRHGQHILDAQGAMLQGTYGRQGTSAKSNYPLELYATLLRERSKTGLRVLCATQHDQIVAAIWVFADTQRCYYWDAVSLEASRDLNANHLLVWCLIGWAHKRGCGVLDFVGTSVGGRGGTRPGIGRFKQSMGARPADYTLLYWYSPGMGALLSAYRSFLVARAWLKSISWKKE